MMDWMKQAEEARKQAYAPYSHFQVGAALLCEDGTVYTGCNIENASYGATNCAERTAFFKAVSEGKRRFSGLALCGGMEGEIESAVPPCGICLQVMREFCPDNFPIYLLEPEGIRTYELKDLLPLGFTTEAMKKEKEIM